jgi:hypothetical protein
MGNQAYEVIIKRISATFRELQKDEGAIAGGGGEETRTDQRSLGC